MLQAFEGIYKNGVIELLEFPENIYESRVLITFLTEPFIPKSPTLSENNSALPCPPLPTHHNRKNTALPIGKTVFFTIRFYMRIKGLEPSLLSEPEPKSGASANFAISARSH